MSFNITDENTKQARVKIYCISSVEEAWRAIDYGASALALLSAMPSGPGGIAGGQRAEL